MTLLTQLNNSPKGPVTILGDAYVGETLIARPGGVGDADGIDYATAEFQWLRDGEVIPGAVSQTFVVSDVDVGKHLSVRYSYVDLGGTLEVVTSDREAAVPPAGTPIPDDSGPYNPFVVLGDALVGQQLTARPNGVLDDNGINTATMSFQWLRDGEIIVGATQQVYDVTEADIDANISVVYTYEDLRGQAKSLTSNPKAAVPAPDGGDDCCLIGTEDADNLTASVGLKRISGLDDTDTAFFAGDQSNYTVAYGPDGVSVTDHRTDGFGTIELDGVEFIDFGTEIDAFTGPMNLDQFAGTATLDRATLEAIVEIYVAYFNRAPDAVGLSFWSTAVANGTTLEQMASLFMDQDETRGTYSGDISNADFAAAVYSNILGRSPDQAGFDYWTDALDNAEVSRDQFILRVLEGAKSELKPDIGTDFVDQQLADRAYLENKVDIGAYFAVHKGMSDVENAAMVMALFDGSQTGLDNAASAIDSYYLDALDPSSGEFLLQVVGVLDTPFV